MRWVSVGLAGGIALALALTVVLVLLNRTDQPQERLSAVVTATAYNSVPQQTDGDPNVAAWGDRLKPGMKVIAVSRDLLNKGLTRGVNVKIEGLSGTYKVLDKMHSRWTDKIDIYMGKDIEAAKEWGRQQVTIYWDKPKPKTKTQ
ncbi:3D domain-containing protein [Rhabdochromatium marinum]|uniref:3D domain-containing protein n=1 Tax=Rhabdochromatium marinum TaxID=48729 RepID=UPI0019056790|nr:3D domain-containing protein [Rhabdochromatium marinum]